MSTGNDTPSTQVRLEGASALFTTPDGRVEELHAEDADALRADVLGRLRAEAAELGVVRDLRTSGDRGEHHLFVEPSGGVRVANDERTMTRAERREQRWWTTDPEEGETGADLAEADFGDEDALRPAPTDGDDADDDATDGDVSGEPVEDAAVEPTDDEDGDDPADEDDPADADAGADRAEETFPHDPYDAPVGADAVTEAPDPAALDPLAAEAFAGAPADEPVGEDPTADEDPDTTPAVLDENLEPDDDLEPDDGPAEGADPEDHLDDDGPTGPTAVPTPLGTPAGPIAPVPEFFFPPVGAAGGDADAPGEDEDGPEEEAPRAATEITPVPVSAATAAGEPEPATTESAAAPSEPRSATPRPSFIDPAPEVHPATVTGWRAVLARLGFPVQPSRRELERAERERAVSRQWAGCRTIAVANGKGGVGKTMTTAVLSAVFARHGGGNVLAWDNNDTRGTLGWRTEQGDYDTTIRDLLPQAERLLSATASVSEIARYVHHQTVDRYDVLRSNPELLAADQRITTADFDLLMQVAARYYRMVVFDSGNDESADRWLRMIDSANQLVVPTLAAPESAESAALLLDALRRRDAHSRRLADEAVVIVSQSEKSSAMAVQEIAAGFEGHVRAVHVIPFDDALKAGPIRYDSLQPRTRDAWMRAAAAVAEGL